MAGAEQIALVKCRLDGIDDSTTLRYVPVSEFGLWRHMMETRHGRSVKVEARSYWVAEQAAWWNSGFAAEDLLPVLRLRFERALPEGISETVERFFPAETYPQAQEALLAHFSPELEVRLVAALPGYFMPATAYQPRSVDLPA
jgi:hypothetical protein